MERAVHTIGHSNHPLSRFLELLRAHAITAVGDVRSTPYSRRHPHFDRDRLAESLRAEGVAYVFLGETLGARPAGPACYRDGKVAFTRLAATDAFRMGLDRVEQTLASERPALLCAEAEPLACHRAILVARHLALRRIEVRHILANGGVEAHAQSERRLLRLLHLDQAELFGGEHDLVARAYELQGERIAYARPAAGHAPG